MKFQIRLIKAAAIFILSFLLPACANKDPIPEEKPPDNTPGNRMENLTVKELSPESDNHSIEAAPPLNDCSILIGDVSLSLSESRQGILAKLDAAGFDYSEVQPDSPNEVSYGLYYNAAGCLQIYFLDDTCARIRLINLDPASDQNAQTARGLHPGDTYSQVTDLYGDDYETHTYSYKGIYTIYRYSIGGCICEFGIEGENRDSIYNIDIYLPSQAPIYKYGEEVTESACRRKPSLQSNTPRHPPGQSANFMPARIS